MAKALIEILTNESKRQKYGECSLEIAKKHDLNRTLQRFVEIYGEAIQMKKQQLSAERSDDG